MNIFVVFILLLVSLTGCSDEANVVEYETEIETQVTYDLGFSNIPLDSEFGLVKYDDCYTFRGGDLVFQNKEKTSKGDFQNVILFNNHLYRIVKFYNDGSFRAVLWGVYNDDMQVERTFDLTFVDYNEIMEVLNYDFLYNSNVFPSDFSNYLVKSNDGYYVEFITDIDLINSRYFYADGKYTSYIDDILKTLGIDVICVSDITVYDLDGIHSINGTFSVLPVVTFKAECGFKSGVGTLTDPYVVE